MDNQQIDYTLSCKKLYYARYIEDADMYCRAQEEIAINNAVSQEESLAALQKIKEDVATAIKNNAISDLYEKWGREIMESK